MTEARRRRLGYMARNANRGIHPADSRAVGDALTRITILEQAVRVAGEYLAADRWADAVDTLAEATGRREHVRDRLR